MPQDSASTSCIKSERRPGLQSTARKSVVRLSVTADPAEDPVVKSLEEAGAGSLVSTVVSVLVLVLVLCVGGILFFKLRARRGDVGCSGTPVQFKSKAFKRRGKATSECSTSTSLGSQYSTRIDHGGIMECDTKKLIS